MPASSSDLPPDAGPQVLVVGAGPTGLLLTGELERRDVSCLLIDALDAPRDWDRATVVHSRSMEIFEALGLADPFLERGVKTRAARIHSNGDVLGELNLELTGSRYGFDLGISEEVTESVLTANLEHYGGGVTRSTRLVGLDSGVDGVTASLEIDGEHREVTVDWVVACDGLHSTVRELAGIEFPGSDIEVPWAVFDATIAGWDDDYDVAAPFLDVPPVILTPLPERRWRVYMRPTADDSDLVSEATPVIRRYKPKASFTAVENSTRFRCHSRVATTFRSERVLLAGDAAHACTPAEGHGMNTGLQDAFNLGWKLALVCRGVSGPALLDSYESERRPVAQRVVESGEAAEGGEAMTAASDRAARNVEIRRTFAEAGSAHHEAAAAAELDRCYSDSDIVTGDPNDRLGPGDLLPDTGPVQPESGEARALHELAHLPGHTLLVLGGPDAEGDEFRELSSDLAALGGDSPFVSAVHGLSAADEALAGRMAAEVADQLGVEKTTVLAVRPDRYVGLRHDGRDPAAVAAYLRTLAA